MCSSNLCNRSLAHSLVVREMLVELIERLLGRALLEQDVSFKPPRECRYHLILGELAHGDGEDVVKLFQCALLGLGHPKEDHDEREDVHSTRRKST